MQYRTKKAISTVFWMFAIGAILCVFAAAAFFTGALFGALFSLQK